MAEIELEHSPFGTTTLGALIDALKRRDATHSVYFDFAGFVPAGIDSYRGYYDHLAIGFASAFAKPVTALLGDLLACDGQTFEGYKGGRYRMNLDTPIWVANRGETGSTAIVGIADAEWVTVIRTRWEGGR